MGDQETSDHEPSISALYQAKESQRHWAKGKLFNATKNRATEFPEHQTSWELKGMKPTAQLCTAQIRTLDTRLRESPLNRGPPVQQSTRQSSPQNTMLARSLQTMIAAVNLSTGKGDLGHWSEWKSSKWELSIPEEHSPFESQQYQTKQESSSNT